MKFLLDISGKEDKKKMPHKHTNVAPIPFSASHLFYHVNTLATVKIKW